MLLLESTPSVLVASSIDQVLARVQEHLRDAAFASTDAGRRELAMTIVEEVSAFVLDWQECPPGRRA